METYNSIHTILSKLQISNIRVITPNSIAILFPDMSRQARYESIGRMLDKKIITKIINGVYELTDQPLSSFEKAQAIVPNSYISLESALNYYGIVSQFPHMVTSVTNGKTKTFNINQTYEYVHIKPDLFAGYEKKDGFLIATKEKALIDYLYFASKGLKNTDISEFDLTGIKKDSLNKYPWSKPYAK
jgi:predicted transcriptional regulator of viral defense system